MDLEIQRIYLHSHNMIFKKISGIYVHFSCQQISKIVKLGCAFFFFKSIPFLCFTCAHFASADYTPPPPPPSLSLIINEKMLFRSGLIGVAPLPLLNRCRLWGHIQRISCIICCMYED